MFVQRHLEQKYSRRNCSQPFDTLLFLFIAIKEKKKEENYLLFTQLDPIQFREIIVFWGFGHFYFVSFPSSVLALSEKAFFPGLLCWPRSSKMNISL